MPQKHICLATLAFGAGALLAACSLGDLVFDLPASSTGGASSGTLSASTGGTSSASSPLGSSSSSMMAVCGDGLLSAGEQCDDGNLQQGDGCSQDCKLEMSSDSCPGASIHLTSAKFAVHESLPNNTDSEKPSCGESGPHRIYAVKVDASGTLRAKLRGGFDKSLSLRNQCPSAWTAELHCTRGTGDLETRVWAYPNKSYYFLVGGAKELEFDLEIELEQCGDGAVQGLEECDAKDDPSCVGCLRCTSSDEFMNPENKHCYRIGNKANWWKARSECHAWGGDLVGVGSRAERDFLVAQSALPTNKRVWTSGNDMDAECSFENANEEPWWALWAFDRPNDASHSENCISLTSGAFDDDDCNAKFDYVCERAPGGGCGDGIVQPGEECDDAIKSPYFECKDCTLSCKPGEFEDPSTRHCYRFVSGPGNQKSFQDAATFCQSIGAYLAAVGSQKEQDLLAAAVKTDAWIGASYNNGFSWVNGDPFCFKSWAPGHPMPINGTDCIFMSSLQGRWINISCMQTKNFICERDS